MYYFDLNKFEYFQGTLLLHYLEALSQEAKHRKSSHHHFLKHLNVSLRSPESPLAIGPVKADTDPKANILVMVPRINNLSCLSRPESTYIEVAASTKATRLLHAITSRRDKGLFFCVDSNYLPPYSLKTFLKYAKCFFIPLRFFYAIERVYRMHYSTHAPVLV